MRNELRSSADLLDGEALLQHGEGSFLSGEAPFLRVEGCPLSGEAPFTGRGVPSLGRAENRDAITAVVKKRESSMSTGIGFGIGIPHASTDLIPEVVGALGRSGKGINFDALDNQPVNLVMLFLVPQGQFQKHLHTLANIAKLLHIKEFRQELEQAPDAEAMFQIDPELRWQKDSGADCADAQNGIRSAV